MARHGRILWLEDTEYFRRNYLMFLSCESPENGTGGPVIDHDGSIVGMAFDNGGPNTSILGISIIM
nr:unnamed protein product [Digitaria exilis]